MDAERLALTGFLQRWPEKKVREMTLSDYVGIGNRDTFAQWVETKTRIVGSIKGMTSIKFGIFERKNKENRPKTFQNDKSYSWLKSYPDSREKAFEQIKGEILEVIKAVKRGNFERIDKVSALPELFRWKVAFLYSNERLIPIFKKEALRSIGEHFGLRVTKHTPTSEIQRLMIENKPSWLSVYQFMHHLFDRFGEEPRTNLGARGMRKKRRGVDRKSLELQKRTFSVGGYIAFARHNKIQNALKKELILEFGAKNVSLEEDYVDAKVTLPGNTVFYEVKAAAFPSECIKQALGQLLAYVYAAEVSGNKKLVVVGGQEPHNDDERDFIRYVKNILRLDFEYRAVKTKE